MIQISLLMKSGTGSFKCHINNMIVNTKNSFNFLINHHWLSRRDFRHENKHCSKPYIGLLKSQLNAFLQLSLEDLRHYLTWAKRCHAIQNAEGGTQIWHVHQQHHDSKGPLSKIHHIPFVKSD